MQVEYEEIDGILIPKNRKYKTSNWSANVTDETWIEIIWSDIKFNTKITKDNFIP